MITRDNTDDGNPWGRRVCSAEDKSTRYVAEDNIELQHGSCPLAFMSIAGRYFKRWDDQERKFVSNLQDKYPDD